MKYNTMNTAKKDSNNIRMIGIATISLDKSFKKRILLNGFFIDFSISLTYYNSLFKNGVKKDF